MRDLYVKQGSSLYHIPCSKSLYYSDGESILPTNNVGVKFGGKIVDINEECALELTTDALTTNIQYLNYLKLWF